MVPRGRIFQGRFCSVQPGEDNTEWTEAEQHLPGSLIWKDSHRASETLWIHWTHYGETTGHISCPDPGSQH